MIGKFTRTRVLLSAGLLAGLVWTGTLAAFTDTAETSGSFSTGTVLIDLTPAPVLFAVTDMAPGDVEFASLDVQNDGTLDFDYGMATSVVAAGNGLASELQAEVRAEVDSCDAAGFGTGVGYAPAGDLDTLSSGAGVRPLAVSGSEALCFRVELPSGADNALQGETAEVTFTFTATQS